MGGQGAEGRVQPAGTAGKDGKGAPEVVILPPHGDTPIGGTLVWYYSICPREAWLIGHAIQPDEDDPNLVYGRFLHRHAYRRQRRDRDEVLLEGSRIDILLDGNGKTVVVEVKKSDRYLTSARLQLAHYLLLLEEHGVPATGELRLPEQRRKEQVTLDETLRSRVRRIRAEIAALLRQPTPPPPRRIAWCRRCAYAEFCWS